MAELGTTWEREDLGGNRRRMVLHSAPIAYAVNGAMRRIDNALGATGDPALGLGVDQLIQFRVRQRLSGDAPVVHFGHGGTHVRFTPLGTANVLGVVAGNAITFPDAWPNADLRITNAGHAVHKEVILRAGHPASFAFRVDENGGFDEATLAAPTWRIMPPSLSRTITTGPDDGPPLAWAKSSQGGKLILTVTLPPGNWAGWTLDPTVTMRTGVSGYAGCTWFGMNNVFTNKTYLSNGADIAIWAGGTAKYRGGLRFDVSAISGPVTVNTATLSLMFRAETTTTDYNVTISKFLKAWNQPAADANPAGANEPCWNYQYYNGTAWGTAGASGDAADYDSSVAATASVTAISTVIQFQSESVDTLVAGWINGTVSNYGWRVSGDESTADASKQWCTGAYSIESARPLLTIDYTAAAAFKPYWIPQRTRMIGATL